MISLIKRFAKQFLILVLCFSNQLAFSIGPDKQKHLEKTYKCVVIGGGVGGYNSAIQLSRFGYPVLLIRGRLPGGQLVENHFVQNWPGELEIMGKALIEKFQEHASFLGVEFMDKDVCAVDFSSKSLKITVDNGDRTKSDLIADSCIISTGVTQNKLNIAGEREFWGKGVSSCIICDGPFYKNKPVAVVGSGDSALSKIEFLNAFSNKIYLISRSDKLRGFGWKAHFLKNNSKFELLFSTNVVQILGQNGSVCGIKIKDKSGKESVLDVSALFLSIGASPNTEIFDGQLVLDENKFIKVDKNQKTSRENVFAVGDCCLQNHKQAVTTASQSFIAAIEVVKYLSLNKIEPSVEKIEPIIKSPFIPIDDKIIDFDEKDLLNMPKQGFLRRDGDPIIEIQSIADINFHLKKIKKPRVLNLYTTWCLACNELHPIFDDLASEYSDKIAFFSANADRSHDIVYNFEIMGIPTIIFFDKDGNFVESIYGEKVTKQTLEEKLKSLIC